MMMHIPNNITLGFRHYLFPSKQHRGFNKSGGGSRFFGVSVFVQVLTSIISQDLSTELHPYAATIARTCSGFHSHPQRLEPAQVSLCINQ